MSQRRKPPETDHLPPHSPEAEQGFLSSLLQDPTLFTHCATVRGEIFYDLRNAEIYGAMRELYKARKVIDIITLQAALKKAGQFDHVGGILYLNEVNDAAPSPSNWRYYLEILLEKFALRKTIALCTDTAARCLDYEGALSDLMQGVRADLELCTALGTREEKPPITIWTADKLAEWQAPDHLRLIGDNEINKGYEGLTLIAGPGSSGKSLASMTLALAGAIGSGLWMGRKVHRRFKTLIIQAENGPIRLKAELEALDRNHPEADVTKWIFISEPPEGGLPFHRPEFRSAVREQILTLKPDLVILDPWSQIAAEDSAKDVVDKLAEIRSCFPAGEECPGLVIIAHTKKPRPEDVRRGRALTNLVSGSVALPNTCRCVYMLLPWSDDFTDERIYWCCPKLNNGTMYAATVWRRKFGDFFTHDADTDPTSWGIEEREEEEHRAILEEDLKKAFGTESRLTKSVLAGRLSKNLGIGTSTVFHAIKPGRRGYLAPMLEETAEGWLKLASAADLAPSGKHRNNGK